MSTRKKNRDKDKLAARSILAPCTVAANIIQNLYRDAETIFEGEKAQGLDFHALQAELEGRCVSLINGDMSRVEAMLMGQAHSLQAISAFFAYKMANAEYMSTLEEYARLSFNAQNQCRQTLATLVELKNPKRATFIKQQNNAVNQQINQRENPKNTEYPANKILEEIPSERLDPRTPQAAIGVNQEVEAMGENHRTKDGRREKEG
jgi:hypothetical protein